MILFLFTTILMSSCEKQLNVKPLQSLDADEALSTSTGVINTLFGAYQRLQGGQLLGTNSILIGELFASGNELTFDGTFAGYLDIASQNLVSNNAEATRTWIRGYETINVVNNVIANINNVEANEKNKVLGEAKFIRGLVYFELVRYFAQPYNSSTTNEGFGVPLILNPTKKADETLKVGRNKISEVYAQVIADLLEAKTLLPASNTNGRATTYSASGILARVYLQQSDFIKAANEATFIINSQKFSLVQNYSDEFNNSSNSVEDIFAIQQNEQSNAGTSNDGLATFFSSGLRGDIYIESSHFNLYEVNDERLSLFYDGERCGKWLDPYSNIPIIRLAEMYLTRAESNFRNSSTLGGNTPTQDINLIRARVNLNPIIVTSVNQILLERKKELAFEGDLFHTLKRTNRNIVNKPYNDPKLVLPIPQREIDANPIIAKQQNAGYN